MPLVTAIVRLNTLLRGELAAMALYREIIALLADTADAESLRRILAGHEEIAKHLRLHLRQGGATPEESDTSWSIFVNLDPTSVTDALACVLEALHTSEALGRREYDAAADNDDLPTSIREVIRTRISPIAVEHVGILARMISHDENGPCRDTSARADGSTRPP